MELTERTLHSKTVFEGRIITVQVDEARLPDGKTAGREVVRHPGGVTVLPLGADNTVTLVRQYRYPLGQELLELPAGKLERNGEGHRAAAIRELGEETGLEAGQLIYLGHLVSSPGFCDERLHLYLARDLVQKQQHLDEDEFLNVVTMPFDQLLARVMDGTVIDAKTVAAVLKAKVLLGL